MIASAETKFRYKSKLEGRKDFAFLANFNFRCCSDFFCRNLGRNFSGIKALMAVENGHRSRYQPENSGDNGV